MPEALFLIEHNLCKEYTALTPFELEERTFREVIRLFSDCKKLITDQAAKMDPNRVIKVKAGDDWF